MGRKCSHCGNTGHNSRTCTIYNNNNNNRGATNYTTRTGLRLFGVQLLDVSSSSSSLSAAANAIITSNSMKRSSSMDNCLISSVPNSPSSSSSRVSFNEISDKSTSFGSLSDGLLAPPHKTKKGVPWTEEEHQAFLAGLEKRGKGDWRGISRNFVTTRTPTQVASHAQKYFLRQATDLAKKKRRSSLFDMVNNSNLKPRDLNAAKYLHEDKKLQPQVDLNSSVQDVEITRSPEMEYSHPPLWTCGSLNSQMNNSSTPDLELKLAAPKPSPRVLAT